MKNLIADIGDVTEIEFYSTTESVAFNATLSVFVVEREYKFFYLHIIVKIAKAVIWYAGFKDRFL